MKCTHCHEEVVLVPSATERAAKYGGTPEFYTKLFPMHNKCIMELRRQSTLELMQNARRVYQTTNAIRLVLPVLR